MVLLASIIGLMSATSVLSAAPCRMMTYKGVDYIACDADPSTVRVFHADSSGHPYGGFVPLRDALRVDQMRLGFAMNGGMYEADLSAVGLLVTEGVVRHPLASGEGWGNFYLKPNGVFAILGSRAVVMETGQFARSQLTPDFATQSGPMLVIDGAIHPAFLPEGTSLQIRNGVGVDDAGRVHLAISLSPVRFHDFATLFRDRLGCRNALFLDGHISSLYAPALGRVDTAHPMGPIIGVVAPMWRSAPPPDDESGEGSN